MMPELFRDEVFQIETARLWLRWPACSDEPDIRAYAGDARVAAMTAAVPHPYTPEHARAYVEGARADNAAGLGLVLAVAQKRSGRVIGGISLRLREGEPALGYALGPAHWGLGLATEAARAIVDSHFRFGAGDCLGLTALPQNVGSRRVAEKAGFVPVGVKTSSRPAHGDSVEVIAFELTRARWLSHRGYSPAYPWGACERRAA